MVFALLALGVLLAYGRSLSAPFVFDDLPGIVRNESIRQLWPLGPVLLPEQATGTSVVGRPLVNLSLAFNYALGGLEAHGYRLFNVLLHAATGALLFSLTLRTLELPAIRSRFAIAARPFALGATALWALHPLQTESVACVIQRTELLGAFFLLLTVHALLRSVEGAGRRWRIVAIAACTLGVTAKETVATAPLLALLYDRTFLAGTFASAWRLRRGFYLALMATWLPLAALVAHGGGRGGTAGFATGVGVWEYLLTQCRALALYVKLSLWPEPLVLDYGSEVVRDLGAVWMQAGFVVALLVATSIALRLRPVLGFAGAWFFVTLAPSSSFVPLATQTIAEHRMYLPLAAIVWLVAAGVQRGFPRMAVPVFLAVALGLGALTARRLGDYSSALTLWSDTVAKRPDNARARYNLANAYSAAGRAAEAIAHYEAALRLEPRYAAAHFNLAGAFLKLGRDEMAVKHYELALQLDPGAADIHANLAASLVRLQRYPEAVAHYEHAARHGPLAAAELRGFGRALAETGRIPAAEARLREALRLEPRHAESHMLLAMLLATAGKDAEALRHFAEAVALAPDDVGARCALADALAESGRAAESIEHYEAALRLAPGPAAIVHTSLGHALARLGRSAEAIAHYEAALRIDPRDAAARGGLERVRAAATRPGVLRE